MSTPAYQGPGQPLPSSSRSGLTGWLGNLLGGVTPAYQPAPPPAPCPPCPAPVEKPAPAEKPSGEPVEPTTQQPQHGPVHQHAPCDVEIVGDVAPSVFDGGESVIPVGPGPITIVIHPRA